MTSEQLEALAREYAIEITRGMAERLDESSCLLNEAIRATTEYCSDFLKWIGDRYCIVEKELVESQIKAATSLIKAGRTTHNQDKACLGIGRRHAIFCLFPELLKK